MSSFYGSAYYWFVILIMGVIAITIWCWRCHKHGQQRQQILARNLHLVQLQIQQQEEQPSNYRPDAPPAYDDVINKPDDYPIYYEGSASTSLPSTSPEYSGTTNETQELPPYDEVIHSPDYMGGTGNIFVVSPEATINADQLESRTLEPGDRHF